MEKAINAARTNQLPLELPTRRQIVAANASHLQNTWRNIFLKGIIDEEKGAWIMEGTPCDLNRIKMEYRPEDNALSVFFEDLGKRIPLVVNTETHIKCLPLSATRNCFTAHSTKDVGYIVADIGRCDHSGNYHSTAHVQGSLSARGAGNFILTATYIAFAKEDCPFDKNCKPAASLESSATPTEF